MQFYVNYTDGAVRWQIGPYANVVMATKAREWREANGFTHCWVGIGRDETRELVSPIREVAS